IRHGVLHARAASSFGSGRAFGLRCQATAAVRLFLDDLSHVLRACLRCARHGELQTEGRARPLKDKPLASGARRRSGDDAPPPSVPFAARRFARYRAQKRQFAKTTPCKVSGWGMIHMRLLAVSTTDAVMSLRKQSPYRG